MSSFNVPTYEVDHLSFAKHPSFETLFREALCIVNDAKCAAYYNPHSNSGWEEDDQGEEVLEARLNQANMAYTIILDYEKLAGTEFYNEVIRKGNPKLKINNNKLRLSGEGMEGVSAAHIESNPSLLGRRMRWQRRLGDLQVSPESHSPPQREGSFSRSC